MSDRFPEMNNFPRDDIILAAVGQRVDVGVHQEHPALGPVSEHVWALCDQVAADVLDRLGIRDESARRLCNLMGETVIGRLVSSDGFTAKFGDPDRPREVLVVNLRPEPTRTTQAEVTRTGES